MKATVLIVDDETGFVDTLVKRLEKRGLTAYAAHSGQEGLDRLRDHPGIEVVILDVRMPEMNGIEALRRMKQQAPLVEVVMLSGHATVDDAIDGMQRGAFDFLLKPCDLDLLIAKIDEAAQQKRKQEKKIEDARRQQKAYRLSGKSDHV